MKEGRYMRRIRWYIVMVLGILFMLSGTARSDKLSEYLGEAMKRLSVVRNAPSLAVLTDAGYVTVNGQSTLPCIDTIGEITGCTAGSGRLLFYHRSIDSPLSIVLFDKETMSCVVITRTGRETVIGDVVDIGLDRLGNEHDWGIIRDKLGADAFAIVSFTHHWAAGAPYDFFKCAEFHDHICPGVTSGYFLANYIRSHPVSYTHLTLPTN